MRDPELVQPGRPCIEVTAVRHQQLKVVKSDLALVEEIRASGMVNEAELKARARLGQADLLDMAVWPDVLATLLHGPTLNRLPVLKLDGAGLPEQVAIHVVRGDSEVRSLAVHRDRGLEAGAPLGADLLKLGRRAAR